MRQHLDDARSLLELAWEQAAAVIDIGSGGGLPAIPLALALPGTRFTLLEANGRKGAFLQHAAATLPLRNVDVVVGRAETLAHEARYREGFDRAISRAAAPPPVLLELALPFVKAGGDLVAQVGAIDISALASPSRQLGGAAPRLQRTSTGYLLLVSKVEPTPPRFPRRPGVPNRRPLA